MLTCKKVSELVSQSLDRPLGPVERLRLQLHLRVCDACRNFRDQMSILRKCVRKHPGLKDLDD